jgi:hypothetical protein
MAGKPREGRGFGRGFLGVFPFPAPFVPRTSCPLLVAPGHVLRATCFVPRRPEAAQLLGSRKLVPERENSGRISLPCRSPVGYLASCHRGNSGTADGRPGEPGRPAAHPPAAGLRVGWRGVIRRVPGTIASAALPAPTEVGQAGDGRADSARVERKRSTIAGRSAGVETRRRAVEGGPGRKRHGPSSRGAGDRKRSEATRRWAGNGAPNLVRGVCLSQIPRGRERHTGSVERPPGWKARKGRKPLAPSGVTDRRSVLRRTDRRSARAPRGWRSNPRLPRGLLASGAAAPRFGHASGGTSRHAGGSVGPCRIPNVCSRPGRRWCGRFALTGRCCCR